MTCIARLFDSSMLDILGVELIFGVCYRMNN